MIGAILCSVPLSSTAAKPGDVFYSVTNLVRMETNGPAVCSVVTYARTNVLPSMWASRPPPPETLPLEIRERLWLQTTQLVAQVWYFTNKEFDYYLPASFNHFIWTNFVAHTNGRSTLVWSERTRQPGWPAVPPVVTWNTNSLMWGMQGLTALSPGWESEGNPGQVPITALTRRHGYTRGHSMGPDGINTNRTGMRIWFLTVENEVVEVKVLLELVRTMPEAHRDYSVILFDRDLPDSISPMRVVAVTNMRASYDILADGPCPLFMTEQGGNVSAQVPGFTVDIFKGGDSGSPNMLPLPDELVFYGGRSTSGPSAEMQADMDELCRRASLDPRRYQMQWVDLPKAPRW
ncbi:MAG TPA: hypothetical protein VNZ64_00330 [Candidatus Acidoferrum sp.]|nr:hypothetical protein [Candidatus Acidoferrum sp.]